MHDDPKAALPILKGELISKYPDNATYWILLAIANYKLNRQNEALQAAQKAKVLSSDQSIIDISNLILSKAPVSDIENKILRKQ